MEREHGYAFGALIAAVAAGVIVAAYAQHKYGELDPIVLVIAIGPSIFTSLYCICRVSVDDRAIHIRYFAPFRRTKVYLHGEIEFYAPVKSLGANPKPILGMMKATKEKKGFMLFGPGIADFPKLSEFLESLYPNSKEAQPAASENGDKSPPLS